MNLFFDARVFEEPRTGIAKTTLLLYRHCLGIDPSLKIAGLHRNRLHAPLPEAIPAQRIGRWFPKKLWDVAAFNLTVRRFQPQALHFPWNGGIPPLFSRIPVITTLHDVLPLTMADSLQNQKEREAYLARVRCDLRRTDTLFTDSEFSREEVLKYFPETPEPTVVYFGPTLMREGGGILPPEKHVAPYFLYVGGYAQRKGLVPLLRVFLNLYQGKKLTAHLLLTGSPHYFSKEFEELVKLGKACGCLTEKGYVSDQELTDLYLGARALVYPSKYEGFGLPPLEAMNLGCPVITVRATSLPEICGEAVCYIDPDNDHNLARGLLTLENNRPFRDELIAKGKEQAKKFTWENAARTFLAALEKYRP